MQVNGSHVQALVPYFDLANHSCSSSTLHEMDATGQYMQLCAEATTPAAAAAAGGGDGGFVEGQEVLITYAEKGNR